MESVLGLKEDMSTGEHNVLVITINQLLIMF